MQPLRDSWAHSSPKLWTSACTSLPLDHQCLVLLPVPTCCLSPSVSSLVLTNGWVTLEHGPLHHSTAQDHELGVDLCMCSSFSPAPASQSVSHDFCGLSVVPALQILKEALHLPPLGVHFPSYFWKFPGFPPWPLGPPSCNLREVGISWWGFTHQLLE